MKETHLLVLEHLPEKQDIAGTPPGDWNTDGNHFCYLVLPWWVQYLLFHLGILPLNCYLQGSWQWAPLDHALWLSLTTDKMIIPPMGISTVVAARPYRQATDISTAVTASWAGTQTYLPVCLEQSQPGLPASQARAPHSQVHRAVAVTPEEEGAC